MQDLTEKILELVRIASTDLPPDVEIPAAGCGAGRARLGGARRPGDHHEKRGAFPAQLHPHLPGYRHADLLCLYPAGWSTRKLRQQIEAAVVQATQKSYLRPNSVDSLTGKNSGNNLGGSHFPSIHFEEVEGDALTIELMLKGGGCENVGAQYSLPYSELPGSRARPGRGAQSGAGCRPQGAGPGLRAGHLRRGHRRRPRLRYYASKEVLFRQLDDSNPDPQLAALEKTA